MHESDKFKSIALRLSEQVAHLTQLVGKLQSALNQLQLESQSHADFRPLIDQAAVTALIQPSPIKLFSSSPIQEDFSMFEGEMIDEFDPMNPFRTNNSPMLSYVQEDTEETLLLEPLKEIGLSTTELSKTELSTGLLTSSLTTLSSLSSLSTLSTVPTSNNLASLSPPTPSTSLTKRKITRKPSGPLKILIVEDDPLCQQLISHIIKSLHIGHCEIVADGVEAVINTSTNTFDLILMDMQLPHLDGLQATQNIRKFNRRTPIISMTARLGEEDIRRYFEGGIDDVLPKPFDKQSVRRIIEQFFKLSITE